MALDNIKQQIKSYFTLIPYLEDENMAKQGIIEGVSFRGPNIVILILAIFIASLGLNTNSPAVIIGAMLISPLMGPIIGIGLGVGIYDFSLIKRSARNLAAAALFSVAASTIYFMISPVSEGHSELLARTSPTIYDVLIAFFGGAAGIVAVACKQKGNVIPGVAIATALMPPLCTAGYGLATLKMQYFTGAFYLFLINSIFIALSTLIGVKLFRFKEANFVDPNRRRRIKRMITVVVVATILPAVFLTVQMLRESFFVNDANEFIEQQINFSNTRVFSKNAYVKRWKKYIDVTLVGMPVNIDSLRLALETRMEKDGMLRGATLSINQLSAAITPDASPRTEGADELFGTLISQIDRQRSEIDSLQNALLASSRVQMLSAEIAAEIKVVYPEVTYIAINRSLMCNTATGEVDTLNVALVEASSPLKDPEQMKRLIEVRTGLPDVHILETTIPLGNLPAN